MSWYYAESGQQKGPVSEEEFQRLINTGTVARETLVWRDGMSAWEPLSIVAARFQIVIPEVTPLPASGPTATAPDGQVACVECGQAFPAQEVVQYQGRNVCAACKPRLLQRLSEGASLPPTAEGNISEADLLSRDYDLDFSEPFDKAKDAMSRNTMMVLLSPILFYVLTFGSGVFSVIPFAGPFLQLIVSLALMGPVMAGFLTIVLKSLRGEPTEFSMVTIGFGPRYLQLALVQGVMQLVTFLCVFPASLAGAVGTFNGVGGGPPTFNPENLGVLFYLGVGWMLLGFVVIIYTSTCWMYATYLVADKNYGAFAALKLSWKVVRKHWFRSFLAMLLSMILSFIGVLLCCVGLLVTVPFGTCLWASFYRQIFDRLEPARN